MGSRCPAGQVLQTLDEDGNQVCALAVHPQGSHVASAGSDAQIRVYDEATGQPELTLAGGDGVHTAGHRLNIYSLCWSNEDPQVRDLVWGLRCLSALHEQDHGWPTMRAYF